MKQRVQYIDRKYKDKVYSYPFLVESYRDENGRPNTKIIQKLSHLPEHAVKALSNALKRGDAKAFVQRDRIQYRNSLPFGDTWALWTIMEQMGIVKALQILPEHHRTPILSSIIDRVRNPKPFSKRALFDSFEGSLLQRIVPDNDDRCLSEWYNALDSLQSHQMTIQKQLFQKDKGQLYLYDITSTYVEGNCCDLAMFGYNRDGKKGKTIIVIGLLTNSEGRPLAIRPFQGNTNDQTTVLGQVKELNKTFGIEEMIFVGDRGMITSKRISELEGDEYNWVKYITALKRKEMMDFVADDQHPIQLSLFDHKNLVEVVDNEKRYVLCHNPLRTTEDRITRLRLLDKTEKKLQSIANNVADGRLKKRDKIAKRLYSWLNKWNMGRFFTIEYDEGIFHFSRNKKEIERYSVLDGCYVVTSNVPQEQLKHTAVHEKYKDLQKVEKAFRSMKVSDIFMRPVRHWNTSRVKGHIFMCMLAYLVIWEVRKRAHPLLEREPEKRTCEGKSLREIWDELAKISIGNVQIEDDIYENISQITKKQRKILKLLKVSIDKKAKKLCRNESESQKGQTP